MEEEFLGNLDFYKDKLCIRPAEISNNPEVVRRLGVITMNTALEADIFGNVNSTHVTGTKMMNGIGGSGDFTRNAYISIFSCPSITKGGMISNIVPMVSHVDHTEHSVDILITDRVSQTFVARILCRERMKSSTTVFIRNTKSCSATI